MISQRDGIYSAHMLMDLVFVLKQVKSVIGYVLYIFHLSGLIMEEFVVKMI